ncbi:hypothetical protein [Nitrosophilus kaiyonis]|uniref:hypothetical protein n=1 Tax=Nitrosophilus kaiyonis TaxID=2930200 RepID=UPI002490B044|nr:hypothetical protein [Nitrosophilus kaiyonis]
MKKFIIYLLIGLGVPLFAAFPNTNLHIEKNILIKKPHRIKPGIGISNISAKQNLSTGKIDWSITLKCTNLINKNLSFKIKIQQYNKNNKLVCNSYTQNITTKPFVPKKFLDTYVISGETNRCCNSKTIKFTISQQNRLPIKSKKFKKTISKQLIPAVEIKKVTFDTKNYHWKATVRNNTSHRITVTLQGREYVNNRWRDCGGQVLTIEPLSSRYIPFWVTMDYDPNATKLKVELKCNGELLKSVTKNIPK